MWNLRNLGKRHHWHWSVSEVTVGDGGVSAKLKRLAPVGSLRFGSPKASFRVADQSGFINI